jgi:hypothetical protein
MAVIIDPNLIEAVAKRVAVRFAYVPIFICIVCVAGIMGLAFLVCNSLSLEWYTRRFEACVSGGTSPESCQRWAK